MRLQRWTRVGAVAILLGLPVAGCDDGVGPAGDFDAVEAAQTVESMVAAVATDDLENAFGSLEAAGTVLGGGVAALVADPVSPDPATVQAMREPGAIAADVLPPEILGTTFEWDGAEMSYVPSDAAGAPEDGIRVIYYAIDPVSGQPASPLNALGWVDVRDLSTAESDRLGVKVVRTGDGEVTLADYYLDLSFTLTQSSLTVDIASVGYLSNGTDQLNFDVAQGLSATDTELMVTQDYSLDQEGTSNAVAYSATLTADPQSQSEDPGTMDAHAVITNGAQTVELEVSWADNALEGTLYHNTAPVVLISGTLDEPQFTDADGEPLSEEQRAALQDLWDSIGEMFDFVASLFGFVE